MLIRWQRNSILQAGRNSIDIVKGWSFVSSLTALAILYTHKENRGSKISLCRLNQRPGARSRGGRWKSSNDDSEKQEAKEVEEEEGGSVATKGLHTQDQLFLSTWALRLLGFCAPQKAECWFSFRRRNTEALAGDWSSPLHFLFSPFQTASFSHSQNRPLLSHPLPLSVVLFILPHVFFSHVKEYNMPEHYG